MNPAVALRERWKIKRIIQTALTAASEYFSGFLTRQVILDWPLFKNIFKDPKSKTSAINQGPVILTLLPILANKGKGVVLVTI